MKNLVFFVNCHLLHVKRQPWLKLKKKEIPWILPSSSSVCFVPEGVSNLAVTLAVIQACLSLSSLSLQNYTRLLFRFDNKSLEDKKTKWIIVSLNEYFKNLSHICCHSQLRFRISFALKTWQFVKKTIQVSKLVSVSDRMSLNDEKGKQEVRNICIFSHSTLSLRESFAPANPSVILTWCSSDVLYTTSSFSKTCQVSWRLTSISHLF